MQQAVIAFGDFIDRLLGKIIAKHVFWIHRIHALLTLGFIQSPRTGGLPIVIHPSLQTRQVVLINLIGLPVSLAGTSLADTGVAPFLSLIYLALLLWWIDVAGFIISKAIEQPYVVGVMFVIFYVVAALSLVFSFTQAPA